MPALGVAESMMCVESWAALSFKFQIQLAAICERQQLVKRGCRRTAIQVHIADGRCE